MEQKTNEINHEIDRDKLWSIVAYFLFLVPLLAVKNRSSFLNFHINQGIMAWIFCLGGWVLWLYLRVYGIL
jgi:hypothetical protein